MKKQFLVILLTLFTCSFMNAQVPFQSRPTAFTIGHKEFEISLFAPSRYGFYKNTEVFSTVFLDWKLPNVGIKRLWWKKPAKSKQGFFKSRDIYFGTVHNLDYPNMFFKGVQNHKKDYISDTCVLPNVITMRNEARMTFFLKKKTSCDAPNFLFTLRAGVKNSFKLRKDYNMPPVKKTPLWYRETVVCLDTIVWFVGADVDFSLTGRLNMLADLDFYSVDWNVKDYSFESKISVYGYFGMNHNILLTAGVKLVCGTVYSDMKFSVLPMLDVAYLFKLKKKKREVGLFG